MFGMFIVFLSSYLLLFGIRYAVFHFGLGPQDRSHYFYMTDEQKKHHSSTEHFEAWKKINRTQGEERD